MLKLNNINKNIGKFSLRAIDFSVDKGDYFMLVGESGAGKTMLLEIISGLIQPDSGQIILNEKEVNNTPIQKRKIGLVYQNQTLFPHLSVFENIAYPLKSKGLSKTEIKNRVIQLAEDTEIAHLLNRKTQKLSGGEAQRVTIARTLATNPDVLLLDEPLSFLDVQLKKGISSLLRKINQNGQTIVHVTHDYDEVIALANKIAILEQGTIVQAGTPQQVFHNPKSIFVANFVGIKNFYNARLSDSEHNSDLKMVEIAGLKLLVLSAEATNSRGYVMIPGEAITVSDEIISSSAVNNFPGTIKDIFPIKLGLELVVDIGINISAQITFHSLQKLNIEIGKKVWISFKASSITFVME